MDDTTFTLGCGECGHTWLHYSHKSLDEILESDEPFAYGCPECGAEHTLHDEDDFTEVTYDQTDDSNC